MAQSSSPSFLQVLLSVAASCFGVQSEKNRQLDFSQGKLMPYLIVGVLFVAAFVGILLLIVNLAIR